MAYFHSVVMQDKARKFYSETTWPVDIAQLTHHEVEGGGKIFCPYRGPSGELIAQYRPPMSFCFYPTLYY